MENPGIDPNTSHMQSEHSTIWASPPPANSFTNSDSKLKSDDRLRKIYIVI